VTLAAEYVARDYGTGDEGDGYLLMANFATGSFGFTARYGDYGFKDPAGVSTFDTDSFTLSPSYKVGDNLLLVGEYRMDSVDGGADSNQLAIEALFMF
jgi:hypothetical protein